MAFFASLRRVRRRPARRGSALMLTAIALIPLLATLAFVVDWGRMCVTKAELQRAADAAAMAAAWELMDAKTPASRLSARQAEFEARHAAKEYSAMNSSLGKPLTLQDADVQIGYLANPLVPGGQLDTSNPENFNAVRVRVRRDAESNGSIPMYFARILGRKEMDAEASATATFIGNVAGFKKPLAEDDGPYIPILPFALDLETWQQAVNGLGPDEWRYDENAGKFVFGSDGIPEFNLYPQNTGSAANRGIVKIGTSVPSIPHVSRQILYGVSLKDWEYHDGSLTFNENGEVYLEGTPGLRAALQDELSAIRGQGRVVPIFSHVEGDGNNAIYTVVEWAGVRIIDVELTGHDKHLTVQAGEVVTGGTVPSTKPKGKSKYVFSRVWLTH